MLSQSSSVGYTIMGKTADLTVDQKMTIDTLHKEGKTQKRLAVHRALCPSTLIEWRREGKDVVEKKCTSNRDNRTLERIVKQNPFKNVGGDSQRVDWSWSQCFKNHYTQTCARHGFQLSHSLCQATLEQQTASEASCLG
ncbi:30S ribosomal protein S16 [Labeo rohita]|uniref:30S ribosomal protein S16 n=1 Tax=Labeo rohita TaxID=84645 RepID=A0ABQ8M101_LABRO|nr:30S ribosomal protein S16 [Labeo rohita]